MAGASAGDAAGEEGRAGRDGRRVAVSACAAQSACARGALTAPRAVRARGGRVPFSVGAGKLCAMFLCTADVVSTAYCIRAGIIPPAKFVDQRTPLKSKKNERTNVTQHAGTKPGGFVMFICTADVVSTAYCIRADIIPPAKLVDQRTPLKTIEK